VARQEVFGDELVAILDDAKLELPRVDLASEGSWPTM
jgi:hypothetical protein